MRMIVCVHFWFVFLHGSEAKTFVLIAWLCYHTKVKPPHLNLEVLYVTLFSPELAKKLKEHGVMVKGNIDTLKKLLTEHGIALVETVIFKLISGWEGKTKGILQVLWVGWLFDSSKWNRVLHWVARKKCMMFFQGQVWSTNFAQEESLLQTMGERMDFTVDRTPKCHCKLVGEDQVCMGMLKEYLSLNAAEPKKEKRNIQEPS